MGFVLTRWILLFIPFVDTARSEPVAKPSTLERSYWLHASLGLLTQKGYFGHDYPGTTAPTRGEIENAAALLSGAYGANRLYLMYHREMPIEDALRVFAWWRASCPSSVEIVPTLLLKLYDKEQGPVFSDGEIGGLAEFFHEKINRDRVGVYDIYEKRDQGDGVDVLAKRFPGGLVRVGQQPTEEIEAPFASVVQDTWSGFCHGTRNEEDWKQPGFGAETLERWVAARNTGPGSVAWDLVVVAWDYKATERGDYPGYDDAEKNMPLPAGRNRLAVSLIREAAAGKSFAGFSSDLYILQENSRSTVHDGPEESFYQTLKTGKRYDGFYATPFNEIAAIYRELGKGNWPED